jgi:hypothetical protein
MKNKGNKKVLDLKPLPSLNGIVGVTKKELKLFEE